MRPMLTITAVDAVDKVPMQVQAEAQALAGVTIGSVAAAGGGMPHGREASHHAPIADHKPLLLHPGPPRSLLSSPAKTKVGNVSPIKKSDCLFCEFIQFT